MNVRRGDVVLIDYPYAQGGGTKARPVLVVQNNRDNQRLPNTIVAQITSVTKRSLEPTQILIELASSEGRQSGLIQNSVVNCVNLFTLGKNRILRKLGSLPDSFMREVDACLKTALDLS